MIKRNSLLQIGYSGFVAVLIFALLRATNPIAIKFALNTEWPPFLLGLFRVACIGMIIRTWGWMLKESTFGTDPKARVYSFTASLCKAISVILFYAALSEIPASRVIVISSLAPIVSMLFVYLLLPNEQVTAKRLIGIMVSFLGMALLFTTQEKNTDYLLAVNYNLTGDSFAIGNVIFLQLMFVYEKKALDRGTNPRQLLNASNLFSVIAFAVCFVFSKESIHAIPISFPSMTSFLYLISCTGVLLFYYRRWLASKLEVSYISSFFYLEKVFSLLFAAFVLNETISLLSFFAFGVILSGTVIASDFVSGNKGNES